MSYKDIDVAELDQLLQQDGLTIIDTRDDATRAKGILAGAIPPSDAVISNLVRRRRSNPPVLVYCYRGNSSRDMCAFLGQLGLESVYNLTGGWEAWEHWQQKASAAATSAPGPADALLTDWLLSHGFDPADLNSRVDLGMDALMLAALHGEAGHVEALLAAGADPRSVNDDEHHALWFACVHGDVALVQRLIAAGCNINNRNINGVTCVIYAASTGKLEVLQTLVDAGADLSITTHDEVSVLESAASLPVLRYLRPLIRQAS